MNTSQSSYEQPQDTISIWGVSEWINYISDEKLKSYVCNIPEWTNVIGFSTEAKSIICLKSEWEDQVMYALCRKPDWTTRLLNTLELRKLNQVIEQYNISESLAKLILPVQYKQFINSSINKQKNKFSDGKYTYTSNRWQKFDVKIENKQAIEIKPHGSILLWSNVWAIKRCITLWFDKNFQKYWELKQTQNNVIETHKNHVLNSVESIQYEEKTIDNIPTQKISTWLIVNTTQSLVQESLEKNKAKNKKFNDLRSLENILSRELKNFIDYDTQYKPSDIQLRAAQNIFVIFSERTNVETTEISVLLNNPNITWLIFQSIENNLRKELSDDIKYLNLLIQLLWKVKEVFSWYHLPEKPAEELNEDDKWAMIQELRKIHKIQNEKRAYH